MFYSAVAILKISSSSARLENKQWKTSFEGNAIKKYCKPAKIIYP